MAVELPTVAHNEALAGDTLTTLTLNYQWRQWVSIAIYTELRRQLKSDVESEQDQLNTWIDDLITDLYNPEVQQDMTAVGTIACFPSETAPDKWLYLNGQTVLRSEYPELWDITPSAWHLIGIPPSGVDQIILPDMRERFARGATNSGAIGGTGGADTHTLTIAEIPAHEHDVSKANVTGTAIQRAMTGNNTQVGLQQTSSVGGGGAHNNLPRYMMFAWMIKALP